MSRVRLRDNIEEKALLGERVDWAYRDTQSTKVQWRKLEVQLLPAVFEALGSFFSTTKGIRKSQAGGHNSPSY